MAKGFNRKYTNSYARLVYGKVSKVRKTCLRVPPVPLRYNQGVPLSKLDPHRSSFILVKGTRFSRLSCTCDERERPESEAYGLFLDLGFSITPKLHPVKLNLEV